MLRIKRRARFSWFKIFLIIVLGFAFYYLVLRNWVSSLITQKVLYREQLIARAEAKNIESFFQEFGDSVIMLSQLSSMEVWGDKTKDDMDAFVRRWSRNSLVGGVVLIDKNGVVKFNSNLSEAVEVGTLLSDKDYFLWAKDQTKEGEYFVGRPGIGRMGENHNQFIIPVAAPVFLKGSFVGVVIGPVKLRFLTERYLGMMKISDKTEVYLIDGDGDLLYANKTPDLVESNIFEPAHDDTLLGSQAHEDSIKAALATAKEGKLKVNYRDTKTGKLKTYFMAYSPVNLENQKWLLIVASPPEDVIGASFAFHIQQAGILLILYSTIFIFGIVVARRR